jgi:fructosamine-3-kinase
VASTPEALPPAVRARLGSAVVASEELGGGCINTVRRLRLADGSSAVLKTNASAPAGLFAREAEGLAALHLDGGPTVPEVLGAADDFLLLEDLRPASPARGYWPEFGRRLARLHRVTSERFGFAHDNWLGASPQPNGCMDDGWAFFAERRLRHQARLAARWKLDARIERVCARLRELVPPQPASLIHGDLWSGNAMVDAHGMPALIDPAAHHGWAEAELAMTRLFGGFPESFYAAYAEVRPLAPGFAERVDLYNLYHLLNHLVLFGASYLGQVEAILARYA